jgi:outer membrane lipoprotein SlyB
MKIKHLLCCATLSSTLAQLALADQTLDAALGGALGGGAGAAIGQQAGGREGAVIGGALGAAVGTTITTKHSHHESRSQYYEAREPVIIEHHEHRTFCPPGQAKKGNC